MSGGRASSQKGNRFERELVNEAREKGIKAERAYGSNGRALGESEEVDALIGGARVQAKRRARLAAYLKPPKDADILAVREDRGETFAVMRWEDFLDLLRRIDGW